MKWENVIVGRLAVVISYVTVTLMDTSNDVLEGLNSGSKYPSLKFVSYEA